MLSLIYQQKVKWAGMSVPFLFCMTHQATTMSNRSLIQGHGSKELVILLLSELIEVIISFMPFITHIRDISAQLLIP